MSDPRSTVAFAPLDPSGKTFGVPPTATAIDELEEVSSSPGLTEPTASRDERPSRQRGEREALEGRIAASRAKAEASRSRFDQQQKFFRTLDTLAPRTRRAVFAVHRFSRVRGRRSVRARSVRARRTRAVRTTRAGPADGPPGPKAWRSLGKLCLEGAS